MKLFLLLVLSHILGGVVFTSSRLAKLKRSGSLFYQVTATGAHCGVHSFWAGLFLFITGGPWIKGAFLVLGFHFVIDIIRSSVEMSWYGAGRVYMTRYEFMARLKGMKEDHGMMLAPMSKRYLLINILDQIAHLASLYPIVRIV